MAPRSTRRRLLGTAAVAATGGVAAGLLGDELIGGTTDAAASVVPFRGDKQAGITTSAPDRLVFAAFDVVDGTSRAALAEMLAQWTEAAERMARGEEVGQSDVQLSPPQDTGEATGLSAANLTVTFGFGSSLFGRDGLGLAARKPKQLTRLPKLPGDLLDADRSDGDLCVQACADDPQVAFHAVRNLARIGRGVVVMRWTQLGFGRTSRTTEDQGTPRNLMGFRDGTNNITAQDAAGLRDYVWVGDEGPDWLRGGTYLVARRIRMLIEVWDRGTLKAQEETFGRHKRSGAPLGGSHEHDAVDLDAKNTDGTPRIAADAHIRLAAPDTNGGIRILRRGYSFTDGVDPQLGQLDAGLMFIAFMRDPQQFVTLQNRLGASDQLNEYIRHESSAVFAIPPGTSSGESIGAKLLG
ncbi:MAG: iron uptake transporter deferrochelatase/peroxidase subunit [Patulibacter sp.]